MFRTGPRAGLGRAKKNSGLGPARLSKGKGKGRGVSPLGFLAGEWMTNCQSIGDGIYFTQCCECTAPNTPPFWIRFLSFTFAPFVQRLVSMVR